MLMNALLEGTPVTVTLTVLTTSQVSPVFVMKATLEVALNAFVSRVCIIRFFGSYVYTYWYVTDIH